LRAALQQPISVWFASFSDAYAHTRVQIVFYFTISRTQWQQRRTGALRDSHHGPWMDWKP